MNFNLISGKVFRPKGNANRKLSEQVRPGIWLVSPNGEIGFVASVTHDLGLSMLTTVQVNGQHFELSVRSPTVFNELFKDWKISDVNPRTVKG